MYAPSLNTLRPSLQQLDQLVEPLTEGELRVAEALKRLDAGWSVFVKPRVGLDRPDFLAISDTFGVCVIQVVDWLPESTRRNDDDEIEILGANGAWSTVVEPRFTASRSRMLVFDQFYAMPEDGGAPTASVRAMVIMPNFTTTEAKSLLAVLPPDEPQSVIGVFGSDSVNESIRDMVVGLGCPVPPSPSIAKLRQQIVPSERRSSDDSELSWMSDGIAMIAENPSGEKIRRFRGSAGSGKSYGLTARAARLAAEGKTVLMLTLNVTLANRLRSMANERCAEIGANPTLIASSNFHTFCTRVVQDAEMAGLSLASPRGAAWTVGIVAKTEQALSQGFEAHYDAILIDEGQDFTLEWWNLLRHSVLAPDGEMLVVADPTQDIYDRFEWTADPELDDADFRGDWIDLETSFRMPLDLLQLSNTFAEGQLEGERLLGLAPSETSSMPGTGSVADGSVRNWFDIERLNQLGRSVGHEVVRLLRESPTLRPADVAFVCDYHHDGVAAVKVIEAAGYPVHHIFSRNPDAPRRRRKHRFWPKENAVKGCTAHSLKGWETPALVMGIGTDDRAQRLAYVAMTRVATRPEGGPSFVSIINADSRLKEFGATFVSGSASAPTRPSIASIAEQAPFEEIEVPTLTAPMLDLAPPSASKQPTPDLAAPSLSTPDLAAPSLSAPPLAAAEMSPPDLVAPDLVAPELAAPDLAAPDLAAPDMAAPAPMSAPEPAVEPSGLVQMPPPPMGAPDDLSAPGADTAAIDDMGRPVADEYDDAMAPPPAVQSPSVTTLQAPVIFSPPMPVEACDNTPFSVVEPFDESPFGDPSVADHVPVVDAPAPPPVFSSGLPDMAPPSATSPMSEPPVDAALSAS